MDAPGWPEAAVVYPMGGGVQKDHPPPPHRFRFHLSSRDIPLSSSGPAPSSGGFSLLFVRTERREGNPI